MTKTIGELTASGSLTGTNMLEIENDDGESVKISLADIAVWIKAEESIVSENLPYRGARVRNSGAVTPSSSGFYIVPWDTEDRDTDGIWTVAAPTRLTIPSGITKVRLAAYLRSPAGPTGRYAFFKKNGAYFIGGAGNGAAAATYDMNLVSDVVDVTAGDYFELEVFGSTANLAGGAGDPAGLATWFALEVIEAS